MKIQRVLFVPGKSAFFFDDQKAIKKGARADGFIYEGHPVTKGFERIRMAGECVSIILELEDGQLARGDCAAVQYSGVGGRDPLFLAGHYLPVMKNICSPFWKEWRLSLSGKWPLDSSSLNLKAEGSTQPSDTVSPRLSLRPGPKPRRNS